MNEQTNDRAGTEYARLVEAIGPGFHPDTPGGEYVELPEGVTAEHVDGVVADVLAAGVDVYSVAYDIVTAMIEEEEDGG